MQNSIKINLIGICICLFSSCVHYPKLAKPANPIQILTFKNLEGRYLLNTSCSSGFCSIDHLWPGYLANNPVPEGEVLEGEIKHVNNHKLILTLFKNGNKVAERKVTGDLKGGYFAIDGTHYKNPDSPKKNYQKTLIEMGSKQELIVHTRHASYSQFLGIPLGSNTRELLNHQIKRK